MIDALARRGANLFASLAVAALASACATPGDRYAELMEDARGVIRCERTATEHDRLDCEQFVDTLIWEHERLAKGALGRAEDDEKVKSDDAPVGGR